MTSASASQERPARTVVRAELPSGAECLGEWTDAGDALGVVVLMHGLDRDLDDMRSLATSLSAAGLGVLNLDLPGHGLSAGSYWRDGTAAVGAAAAFAATRGSGEVAFVADGLTCSVLVGAGVAATAAVLIDPHAGAESPPPNEVWTTVPSVLIQDPLDEAATAEVDAIVARTRAWTLRIHLHSEDRPATAEDRPNRSTRLGGLQVGSITAKFMLEQFTYAAARSRRWSAAEVEGGPDVDS